MFSPFISSLSISNFNITTKHFQDSADTNNHFENPSEEMAVLRKLLPPARIINTEDPSATTGGALEVRGCSHQSNELG